MKEQMDRDTLLYKICPMHRIHDCCNGTRDYKCYDCAQLMGKWLDEYDKQIRTEAIDDVLKLQKYTFYDTSNEFMNIRIDAISIEDILKLKEQNNEQ